MDKKYLIGGGAILFILLVVGLIIWNAAKSEDYKDSNKTGDEVVDENDNNTGGQEDYDAINYKCLYTSKDKVVSADPYTFKILIGKMDDDVDTWDVKDDGTRSFKIDEFLAGGTKSKLYMMMWRTDKTEYKSDVMFTAQMCNSSDKTNYSMYKADKNVLNTYSDPGEGLSMSSYQEVGPYLGPKTTGKYRVDGLAFIDGQWKLVARLDGVELK